MQQHHITIPYPHEGGCIGCRTLRVCNVCSKPLDIGRCTNGRCASCHAAVCTPGGGTSPGHGYGLPKDCGRPHPQPYCMCRACAAASARSQSRGSGLIPVLLGLSLAVAATYACAGIGTDAWHVLMGRLTAALTGGGS